MGRPTLRRWTAGLLAATAAAAAAAPSDLDAHALHTTLTVMTFAPVERAALLSIRVFADDFGAAAARHGGVSGHAPPTDAAAFRYVQATVAIAGTGGRRVPLQWCGMRRVGDLLWLCLKAPAPTGLAGLEVRSGLLFEAFTDQVNIVQATYGGRRTSLLFTNGAGAKRLP